MRFEVVPARGSGGTCGGVTMPSSSISPTTAAGFSRPDVAGFYTVKNEKLDELLPHLRVRAIAGHQVRYPTVEGAALETFTTVVGSLDQAVSTTWPALGKSEGAISRFVSNAEINEQVTRRYGSFNNILRELLKVRVRSLLAAFSDKVVNGDPSVNAAEFKGLKKHATDAGKTLGAGDAAGTPGVLGSGDIETAVNLLRPGRGGSVLLLGNADAYKMLSRSAAYAGQISWAHDPISGHPVRMISGVPLLRNDFIKTASGTTDLIAVAVSGEQRVEIIYPRANAGREIRIEGPFHAQGAAREQYVVAASLGFVGIGEPVAMVGSINVT